MNITVFNTKEFERPYIKRTKNLQQNLQFFHQALDEDTVELAVCSKEIIVFPADDLSLLITDSIKYHIDNERLKLMKKT